MRCQTGMMALKLERKSQLINLLVSLVRTSYIMKKICGEEVEDAEAVGFREDETPDDDFDGGK